MLTTYRKCIGSGESDNDLQLILAFYKINKTLGGLNDTGHKF